MSEQKSVILGVGGGRHRWFWPAVGGGMAVLVVLVTVLLGQGQEKKEGVGCNAEGAGCAAGNICALGGCIPLISEENVNMWHDELAQQAGEKPGSFSPHPTVGMTLKNPTQCPAKERSEEPENRGGAVTVKGEATVVEVRADGVRVIRQKKVSSSMWLDQVWFRFEVLSGLDDPAFCTSDGVDSVFVDAQKTETRVKAVLSQSVPAGTVAEVSLAEYRSFLSNPRERFSLSFTLAPVRSRERREMTVLVLPLGIEVFSLSGPMPVAQRLLTGYVAYFYEHGDKRVQLKLDARLPSTPSAQPVNLAEIKPRV